MNDEGSVINGGQNVVLSMKSVHTHTHLKAGSMIPIQSSDGVKTTFDLMKKPISLYALRDEDGYAYGSVFLDSGDSIDDLDTSKIEYYQLHL